MRQGNADRRVVALELTVHACMGGTVHLVRPIDALPHAVADARRWDALNGCVGVGALEEAWLVAVVRLASGGLIGVVPAVVLAIAAPPERDALKRLLTQELRTETESELKYKVTWS